MTEVSVSLNKSFNEWYVTLRGNEQTFTFPVDAENPSHAEDIRRDFEEQFQYFQKR